MMKILILLSIVAAVCHGEGPYVWDLLKPALDAAEIETLVATKGLDFPTLTEIPDSDFDCSSMKQPGFYADVKSRCQVFHRCDQSGVRTSYLCVNSTIFNQITLICDAWFNVECERSGEFVDFANSRLYTDKPLFDTPPADYVSPGQLKQQEAQKVLLESLGNVGGPHVSVISGKPARKPKKSIAKHINMPRSDTDTAENPELTQTNSENTSNA